MVRNAAIGLVAFLAGLLTAYVLSHSATTLPEVPMDQVSMRFDALDEALATLDRTLRSEASRPDLGLLNPLRAEPAGSALEQESVLMREELHGILEALEARHELLPAAEGRQDPPRSAAIYQAQQRSWDVLDGALAAQRWTQEDARDLLASWTELSPPQRQELLGALFAAANRGEIEMEGVNGLF
jgi:hypothetical protein